MAHFVFAKGNVEIQPGDEKQTEEGFALLEDLRSKSPQEGWGLLLFPLDGVLL